MSSHETGTVGFAICFTRGISKQIKQQKHLGDTSSPFPSWGSHYGAGWCTIINPKSYPNCPNDRLRYVVWPPKNLRVLAYLWTFSTLGAAHLTCRFYQTWVWKLYKTSPKVTEKWSYTSIVFPICNLSNLATLDAKTCQKHERNCYHHGQSTYPHVIPWKIKP